MQYKSKYMIFDLDGTIIDSNPGLSNILLNCLQKYNMPTTEEFIVEVKTKSMQWLFSRISEIVKTVTKEEVEVELLKKQKELYEDVELKKSVDEFIKKSYEDGTRLCVATATNSDLAEYVLRKKDLLKYFDFVISTTDLKLQTKDTPDIFLYCANKFKVNDYKEILLFEDSLNALKAAKSIGIRTCAIYDKEKENYVKKVSDYAIYDFSEIL